MCLRISVRSIFDCIDNIHRFCEGASVRSLDYAMGSIQAQVSAGPSLIRRARPSQRQPTSNPKTILFILHGGRGCEGIQAEQTVCAACDQGGQTGRTSTKKCFYHNFVCLYESAGVRVGAMIGVAVADLVSFTTTSKSQAGVGVSHHTSSSGGSNFHPLLLLSILLLLIHTLWIVVVPSSALPWPP